MLALRFERSLPRYLLMRGLARRLPSLCTSPLSPLSLRETPVPGLPGPGWVRVRTRLCGICGSDLSMLRAEGSLALSPFVSFPFVPGHEIVGEVDEAGPEASGLRRGQRVVVEPVLSCAVRGLEEPCPRCRARHEGNCERVTDGDLAPGLQTGFCRDTGGGWSPFFLAHVRQLHPVPDEVPDDEAVLVEPFSCALHAVLRSACPSDATALVLGGGTMGLLTVAALRALGHGGPVFLSARHGHQAEQGLRLGADRILPAGRGLDRAVADLTGARLLRPERGRDVAVGGVEATFDCVGSSRSLEDALRLTRARGQVLVVGMPGIPRGVDWTFLWYKELDVRGAYTYGQESHAGESVRTFELALRLLRDGAVSLAPLVSGRYPLSAWKEALGRALRPGPTRSIKTVFSLGGEAIGP